MPGVPQTSRRLLLQAALGALRTPAVIHRPVTDLGEYPLEGARR